MQTLFFWRGASLQGMGGGPQAPQPSCELPGTPGQPCQPLGHGQTQGEPSGDSRAQGLGREGRVRQRGVCLIDLWTARELGGSPGDFQAKTGWPGMPVGGGGGEKGEWEQVTAFPPGRYALKGRIHQGPIKDVIQRKESMAKNKICKAPVWPMLPHGRRLTEIQRKEQPFLSWCYVESNRTKEQTSKLESSPGLRPEKGLGGM